MALTPKKVYAILKRQISDMESQLNHPVRYKGTVSTSDLLPLNPAIGDMYNIESKSIYGEAGMNVAWNGVTWDTMGAPIDMSLYFTKEEADTTIQNMVNEYFENNPIKPGATTEQAQQIEQNKTDITSLKEETGSLKEDKADKTALFKTDRKLDALWKLNQGISYEFQTDDTEAYQKTVPSGAKMANVKSIGGKTIVWNQLNLNDKNSITRDGISFTNNKDGSWTITGTCSTSNGGSANVLIYKFADKFVSGHKYLVKADKYFDENYGFAINGATFPLKKAVIIDYAFNPVISVKDKVTVDNVTMRMNIFDITQMFGAGNEPSTPKEFEAMFPADYYPYNAGELMSAPVNEVVYLDTKNQETSYPIPQAILNLPGYGWSAGDVRNYVDWEEKRYHKRVGKVDWERLDWEYANDYLGMPVFYTTNIPPGIASKTMNIITSRYIPTDKVFSTQQVDKAIAIATSGAVYVRDNSYSDKDTFVNALNGQIIYYELAEEQIIDISDIIDNIFQEPIEVEAGGTLTFKNSHGDNYRIPVPSSEEYVISLAEVAK
jgi:hypothetical protein